MEWGGLTEKYPTQLPHLNACSLLVVVFMFHFHTFLIKTITNSLVKSLCLSETSQSSLLAFLSPFLSSILPQNLPINCEYSMVFQAQIYRILPRTTMLCYKLLFYFGFCCCNKRLTKNNVGIKGFVSSYILQFKIEHTQGRNQSKYHGGGGCCIKACFS